MDEFDAKIDELMMESDVVDWVVGKCDEWRNHFEGNYQEKFDEYYRLWRGIWDHSDVERKSERSRIITPALQQAVESNVAELEESTFGRGKWFDISDNMGDNEREDIAFLRNKLSEDFEKTKVRKAVAECLINSAVFGTGIAEITLSEEKEMSPATQPINEALTAVGVNVIDRTVVKMRPVMPQNFLIDPVATSIDEALGCAVDEFVSRHHVELLQEQGVYADVFVDDAIPDDDIEPDQDLSIYSDDKIRLTKYYGLVPTKLLENTELFDGETEDTAYTEAVIVIANGGVLLKAEANPYMMQDRPIVAFPWDVVPGRFWGRGVCEKGYNSQKALDAEIRARIDALGLTVHPMMAMDATRIPRGHKPEIRPGKILLTNGDPGQVLKPFNFGEVSQITFAQAGALQQMVQQATGAVDSAGIAGQINGEATAAGISMSLGAIIKRQKRTLINFQQSFLLPFVEKAAWRYMQYDPEHYPVSDYKFNATSTLGIIAREYEVTQLTQLLQTMSPESPLYPALIQSIVENMNLSNREELTSVLQQASQPNPQAQAQQQAMQQAQLEFQQSQTNAINAEAAYSNARAAKAAIEAELEPLKARADLMRSAMGDLENNAEAADFQRRMAVIDKILEQEKIDLKKTEHNDKMKLDVMRELKSQPQQQGGQSQ